MTERQVFRNSLSLKVHTGKNNEILGKASVSVKVSIFSEIGSIGIGIREILSISENVNGTALVNSKFSS